MNDIDLKEVNQQAKRGRPPKVNPEEIASTEVKNDVKDDGYSIEIIRDYYGAVDVTHLSKTNPNYAYRFLRDDHKNLSMKTNNMLFQKGGWQICSRGHLLSIGIKVSEISPDGFLRRGDLILAFMPKKFYEEKEKYKEEKSNAPMKQIRKLIKDGDSSQGSGIHESIKGLQTGKQLGMKSD